MDILYHDDAIVVCVKPPRVLSTDEPGGMPELVRQALNLPSHQVRTVHRLDRVVSGLMVLAVTPEAASELSRQIREDVFQKEYLAVVHGCPEEKAGTLRDLLLRNKQERKTYIVQEPGKGVQEAILHYQWTFSLLPMKAFIWQRWNFLPKRQQRRLHRRPGLARKLPILPCITTVL